MPTREELERCLAGSGALGALIEELSAVVPGPPSPSIRELLGTHLAEVLDRGLAGLPTEVLDDLLRHPRSLRDLQGLIFVAGGDYWARQIDQAAEGFPEEFQAMIERARKRLDDWAKPGE